ncbi:MFS transporter [Sutcliffiella horikoshii]|uniref:MFS transporter n=1 Tax=Sutcliffiella horikoshii TaxID=79883 RepID=A0A5D4T1H4_9BACI|nr:MFS transporter [Sutcliffiella horikoshii]TYS68302.1 MFS transporter [Sutcliffiella horikoshii]
MKGDKITSEEIVASPEKLQLIFRRTLFIVVLSQVFGGAGLAAGITVGALLAQDMLGTDAYSGVPVALLTLGSAGAAYLIGRVSQRFGRRVGLAGGFLTGGISALGVVLAAVTNNVWLLFFSLLFYGAGTASNLQARYAGTDLASAKQRGKAISIALVSTTFGAVAGPNLVGVMGDFAVSIGVPSLAGPFILGAAAFILAGLVLLFYMKPDPLLVSKALENENWKNAENPPLTSPKKNNRGIIIGGSVMVLTQMVMVAIMTMTPIHMGHHGHGLDAIGLVIGIHIGAMYLPSLVTGILVDKVGRTTMASAAGVTLLLAGIIAATAPGDNLFVLIMALALLGLGWNFGLISGTATIVDATTPSSRAKVQGSMDVLVALSGATGGIMSGVIVSHTSFSLLSIGGGLFSLLLLPLIIWASRVNLTDKQVKNKRTA